jgi:phosphotransferase system HPr (HPr) family protein
VAKLSALATHYQAKIEIKNNKKTVDAKSILGLLTLGAKQGEQIEISATGTDAEEAIKAIDALFTNRFDEEE